MIITAHSGCDNTPENSLEYVEYAIQNGANTVEVDVRLVGSKLVISHDEPTGDVPLLSDVFEIIKMNIGVKVNCDLKQNDIEIAVYNLAMGYGLSGRLIYSGYLNPSNLNIAMKNHIEVYFNIEQVVSKAERKFHEIPDFDQKCAELMITACRSHGFKTVNADYRMVSATFVSMLKKHGIGVNCWTVDDICTVNELFSIGVNGITTCRLKDVVTAYAYHKKCCE